MNINIKFKLVFLCIITMIISFTLKTNVYAENDNEKKILIMNSYHYGYKWSDDISIGIKTFTRKKWKNINIVNEYMDTKRCSSEEYYNELYNLYECKYSDKKFDVIVAIGDEAFEFLNKHHKELFDETPIVFCGVDNFDESKLKDKNIFTGVLEKTEIKETIDTMLFIHPNTKEIAFIVDKSMKKQGFLSIESLENIYKDKVNFKIIISSTVKETINNIKDLSSDTGVFFYHIYLEDKERYGGTNQAINEITQNSPVPIYSSWGDYINMGIVGGKLIYGYYHGNTAAGLIDRVLKGEKPGNISIIEENTAKYLFDYNVLKKYNIDNSLLPQESKIINIPSEKYAIPKKNVKQGAMFLISFLLIIIMYLIINILKRKRVEIALKENENRLRTLMDAIPEIICFKNTEGQWLEINDSLKRFLNLEDNEWKYKNEFELCKDNKDLFAADNDENAWNSVDGIRYEREIFKNDGERIIYDIYKIPIFDENNNRKAIVIVGHDITYLKKNKELKKEAIENRKLLHKMKEYDNLRAEFFANISHELRTPLNVILSALQYLEYLDKNDLGINYKDKEIKYKQIKYKQMMTQNCYRLLRLINNLIDITKIDSGYLHLNLKNHNIVSIIEDITLSVVEYIESKDINLIFDTEVEEKNTACDTDMIERIIFNLLSNAIKFTDSGGKIEVTIYDRADNIIISVKDTGIGIPKEKQKCIFERFAQVDKTLSRNKEGSGIGLSLVKALVEMHDGIIYVNSEYEEGSEFIINLPVKKIKDCTGEKCETTLKNNNYAERTIVEFSDI